MLIEKHLISNKTNADRKTEAEDQPYGSLALFTAAHPWQKEMTLEKLEDLCLINHTPQASSGRSQFATGSEPFLICRG